MLKELLKGILTKEQIEAGLWLNEIDDHTLELKQCQVTRAAFSSSTTVWEIQKEAQKWV